MARFNNMPNNKPGRQISIELLRIIAMLMVLGLHANFMALPALTPSDVLSGGGLFRTFMQCLCIVAVNVFVMISGWFGIRASLRGFCNFMWQVFYIVGLLWIIGVLFFDQPVTIKSILWTVGLYGGGGWFVASYIGLYILSPVLNSFLDTNTPRMIAFLLAAFFTFEFIWGNTLSVGFVIGGYSTFSFIGIYLLAGLLRRLNLEYASQTYLKIFVVLVCINTFIFAIITRFNIIAVRDMLLNYISPTVIASASCLLLAFTKMDTSGISSGINDLILKIASSCFAAYLFHVGTSYSLGLYCKGVRNIYDSHSGVMVFILIGLYVIGVFGLAIIIDLPRKFIWHKVIAPKFNK